jgi:glycosyltransferase involved in cell wall biosynthesis
MRILVAVDHWFPDHRGGAARVAAETAMLLAQHGHEVEVLAPADPMLPVLERHGALAVHRVLRRRVLPQTLTDPWETRRAALGRPADLLLAHTSTTAIGLSAALPHAPLALVYHASAAREAQFLRSRLPYGRRHAETHALELLLALLERRALRRTDRVLVLSEFSRGLLEADQPDALPRTRLVRGGVDTQMFTPGSRVEARRRLGLPPTTPLLVAVRRLEPRMGLERLLEALALTHGARPGLELAIVGDGSLRGQLELRRASLALERTVRLVGRVPENELVDWYRAADVCVLPTLAYEGFGLVTAEALACGAPVVGTPVGATPELLGPLDERLLAAGTGAGDLAAAIERGLALASPAFGNRCRAYAESRLSWAATFPSWQAALADIPDIRRGRPACSRGAGGHVPALRSSR